MSITNVIGYGRDIGVTDAPGQVHVNPLITLMWKLDSVLMFVRVWSLITTTDRNTSAVCCEGSVLVVNLNIYFEDPFTAEQHLLY